MELAADTGFHRELAPYLIHAFDRDGDGVLSLHEHCDTPITNPLVQWHVQRKNKDHDNQLDLKEFQQDQALVALPPYSYNARSINRIPSNLSSAPANASNLESESNSTFWIIIAVNLLLVSTFIYYLI